MNRKIAIFICVLLITAITGCNLNTSTENDTLSSEPESLTDATMDNLNSSKIGSYEYTYDLLDTKLSETLTVEECVLWNENNIEIKVVGLEYKESYGEGAYYLNLSVTNNSANDYVVEKEAGCTCVNGYAIQQYAFGGGGVIAYAGDTKDVRVGIECDDLQESGIEIISDIEFNLLFKDESDNVLFETGLLQAKTSAYDTYEYKYDESGIVLMENDDVKIVSKGFYTIYIEEFEVNSTRMNLFIYSKSDEKLYLEITNFTIDGELRSGVGGRKRIVPNKYHIRAMTICELENVLFQFEDSQEIKMTMKIVNEEGEELYNQEITMIYEE